MLILHEHLLSLLELSLKCVTLLALFLVQPAHLDSVHLEGLPHTQYRRPLCFQITLQCPHRHTPKRLCEFHVRR
jgi:hypothetical protein